jgi:hypothetical protein
MDKTETGNTILSMQNIVEKAEQDLHKDNWKIARRRWFSFGPAILINAAFLPCLYSSYSLVSKSIAMPLLRRCA